MPVLAFEASKLMEQWTSIVDLEELHMHQAPEKTAVREQVSVAMD